MEIEDPKACKKIFESTGISGMSENCAAFKFGVLQSFNPSHPARVNQFKRLDKIVNDKVNRSSILVDFDKNASKYLPTEGIVQDLYFEIYLSLLNFLSTSDGYFGFKTIPAGELIRHHWLRWFNLFGENIFSDSPKYSFLEDSITLARTLLVKNLENNDFGPITRLFFEERDIPVPKTVNQLLDLERKEGALLTEVYFEISVRLIRGIDNIAFNLTYCIERDSNENNFFSAQALSTIAIRNYVIENLRYNPPIAKISRITTNKLDALVDDIKIPAQSNITFDIMKYNRSLNTTFNADSSVKKSFGASFGSYTPMSCPAASFTIDVSIKFLQLFWIKRRWASDAVIPHIFKENIRPVLSGKIIDISKKL